MDKSWLARAWLLLCAALILLPIGVVVMGFGDINAEIWAFLLEYQLAELIKNTLILMLTTALGVVVVGVSTAWLTAMYRFPASQLFFWALMLPLTVPAYVLAFVQVGMFDYTGAISTFLRAQYGFAHGLPDTRNIWGLSAVMVLTFYPYVYLLARNAFASMGQRAMEVGASMRLSPAQSVVKVALPMARPWIVGGLLLAMMEVLADFGAVSTFGVETFSTAIYQAWFSMYSIDTAKQLASLLILFVFGLISIEQMNRGGRRFASPNPQARAPQPLQGISKWLATGYCSVILLLGFLWPVLQLMIWAAKHWQIEFLVKFWSPMWHSLLVGLIGAGLTALVALLLVLAKRYDHSRFAQVATRIATLGYAVPGSVLAIGIFIPVAGLDNWLLSWLPVDSTTTGILKGTLMVMLVAYVIRFLALAVSSIDAGFERIRPSLGEAALTLGVHGWRLVARVYLPLIKGSLGVALLMVFVDLMKEMPITLMTRPSGWDTLAVRIYAYTMEGQFEEAALPALAIVLVGLVPVVLFSKMEQRS